MKDWTTHTVSGSPPPTVTYLEGLSLGAVYEVQLQAESAIGRGNFSEVQTATAFDGEEMYNTCAVCMKGKSVWYKFNINVIVSILSGARMQLCCKRSSLCTMKGVVN